MISSASTKRRRTSSSRTRKPTLLPSRGILGRSNTSPRRGSSSSRAHPLSEEAARIQPAQGISEEALRRAEALIEEEEGVQNKLTGRIAAFITITAVVMSLFHLYAAYEIVR